MIKENDLDKLRDEISKYLGSKRLVHTLSVEEECVALAEIFGLGLENKMRLRVAALLHDITKKFTHEEQLNYCFNNNIFYTEEEKFTPKIFHAKTGAHMAKQLFGDIADEIICEAIKYHTTAKANMNLIEILLYLADYIEPKRDFSDCVILRAEFYEMINNLENLELVLNKILTRSFDMTIEGLILNKEIIHPDTTSARNFYIRKILNRD